MLINRILVDAKKHEQGFFEEAMIHGCLLRKKDALGKILTNFFFSGKLGRNFFFMSLRKYLIDAHHELRQVQWPTKNHAIRISIITGIFVIVSTALVAAVDFGLNKALFLGKQTQTLSTPASSLGDVQITSESGETLPISITPASTGPTSSDAIISPESETPPSLSPES